MDDFDYVLSADPDLQKTIEIEAEDEVVNFDNGFYVEDKAVHILNLLSTNNKGLDIQKYKKYWDRKVAGIMDLERPRESRNYNKNVFPNVFYTKKITELDPDDMIKMDMVYNEADVESEPVELYLKTRRNITGKSPTYSHAIENKQYTLLAPFVEDQGTFMVPSDTDVFLGPSERTRMLGPTRDVYKGDSHKLVGYYNQVSSDAEHTTFDVIQYKKALDDLKDGDAITLVMHDGAEVAAKAAGSDGTILKIRVAERKTLLSFDMAHLYKNYYMAYPEPFVHKVSKKDFAEANISFIGATEPISAFSGNDVVIMQPYWQPHTLDEFKVEYPEILENISKNAPLTKYFESFKASLKPKKVIKKRGKQGSNSFGIKTIRELNREKRDDLLVAEVILAWLKKQTVPSSSIATSATDPIPKFKKVFSNVQAMIDDTIDHYDDKAKAALISTTGYFSMKKGKQTFEHPIEYVVFELHHTRFEGVTAWEIGDEVSIPVKKLTAGTGLTKDQVIEHLAAYKLRKNAKLHDFIHPTYQYSTNKTYENFQGQEEFSNELIPEFGIHLVTVDTDGDNEDVVELGSESIISELVSLANVQLSKPQLAYISKIVQLKDDLLTSKTKESILEIFKKLLICFSMMIIFIQIVLPDGSGVVDAFSYPVSKNKRDTGLISYMSKVMTKKLALDPRFTRVFADPNIKTVLSNGLDAFISTIDKILGQKQFLKVLLDAAHNRWKAAGDATRKISHQYPLWATFRPNGKVAAPSKSVKSRINRLYIVKSKKTVVPLPKFVPIKQHDPNVASIDKPKSSTKSVYQEIFDNNTFFSQDENYKLVLDSKWNEFSEKLEEYGHPEFLALAIEVPVTCLCAYLLSVKEVLGKIAHTFKLRSENENATHMDFLKDFYRSSALEQTSTMLAAIDILKNMLNIPMAFPTTVADLKYLIIYICLMVFNRLEQEQGGRKLTVTTTYLLSLFQEKVRLNTMTPEQAMFHFQHEREQRKQKLMAMYKGMDDGIRRLNKQAVDMGLLTRDELLAAAAIAEDVNIRMENERDDYDMNERED